MKTTELTPLTNFKPINYKFIVNAHVIVYPLDRNGNTYHRVTLIDQQGNEIADTGKVYRYDRQYEVTTRSTILACIDLPTRYKKLGGKIAESHYNVSAVFTAMKADKFLNINYIVKS